METQVKSARAKQKYNAKGPRKLSERDERKLSSGPTSEPEHSRRLFALSTNKRAIARFAKGPTETAGFLYPRRRTPTREDFEESSSLEIESHVALEVPSLISTFKQADTSLSQSPESVRDSLELVPESFDHVSESDEKSVHEAGLTSEVVESISDEIELSSKLDDEVSKNLDGPKKTEGDEIPDNTIGPDDSQSSDSESSEEESEVIIKPTPIATKMLEPAVKSISPNPVRKVTMTPVLPLHRKVQPAPPVSSPSSWSKFLPLVIEIKATIPYPMHLLGAALLLVGSLILGLSYQFGADLGSDIDFQGQIFRLLKLAFLFVVVAMCVNFVEDNKELHQKTPISPPQPKLRPSKVSKNKKKLMMKV